MIPKLPIRLTFDPSKSTKLAAVFANPTAWKLWLLWKPCHAVNQFFDDECIEIAEMIDRLKPETTEGLGRCMFLRCGGSNFQTGDVTRFVPEALPFFTGEREVTTVLDLPPPPPPPLRGTELTNHGARIPL